MQVSEFCNREVVVMKADESVQVAAELMRTHHVGDVILIDEQDNKSIPIGIITDRDLAIEVMAPALSSRELIARDLIIEPLSKVYEKDSLHEALEMMRKMGVRRLPVVNHQEELVGIITIDDMVDLLTEMLADVVRVVKKQQRIESKKRT